MLVKLIGKLNNDLLYGNLVQILWLFQESCDNFYGAFRKAVRFVVLSGKLCEREPVFMGVVLIFTMLLEKLCDL